MHAVDIALFLLGIVAIIAVWREGRDVEKRGNKR